jgi:hypothetical protein
MIVPLLSFRGELVVRAPEAVTVEAAAEQACVEYANMHKRAQTVLTLAVSDITIDVSHQRVSGQRAL